MSDAGRHAGGSLSEYAYAEQRGRTTADVVKDIIANVQEIVRSEVRLAKTEAREEVSKFTGAAKILAAGAVLGIYALGFVLASVAMILALALPAWGAVSIVAIVLAIAAYALVSSGVKKLKLVHAKPEKTIESVKENMQWMKNQTKS